MQQILEVLKQETKIKASQILHTTRVQQHYGEYHAFGKFCAIGAIANFFGYEGDEPMSGYDRRMIVELGIDRNTQNSIIIMNDNEGKSFIQIANWLEARGL